MGKWGNMLAVLRSAREAAALVRRLHGVSYLTQAADLLKLRKQGIGPSDYYKYSLFDRKLIPDRSVLGTYRGWRFQRELRRFVDPSLRAVAYEKHLLTRLLESFGLPAPRIHAIYAPGVDTFERHRALTTREDLLGFLRGTGELPLFGKPSSSSHGYGGRGIVERLEGDRFRLADASIVAAEELADDILDIAGRQGTYLLTEMLQPRDDIRALCGSTLSSIRMVILMRDGEPEIFRCGMLLPRERAHVSNARGLTTGTLSSRIDPATGRIGDVIEIAGPERRNRAHHPDTGQLIEGHVIEGWDEIVALAFTAARAFSPFRMQHWDVALTTRGPVLLEMNYVGDVEPLQMHGPPGAADEQFLGFAEKHRVKPRPMA